MHKIPIPDPPLATERVRLRPWRHADAPDLVAGWTDEVVARFNPVPDDTSLEAAQRWIGGWSGRRQTGQALDLVIVADADQPDEVIGEVGVTNFDEHHGSAEIGFWLKSSARRQGYAVEAVRLFSDWLVEVVGVRLLFTRTVPENADSAKALERAGYERRGVSAEGHEVWRFVGA